MIQEFIQLTAFNEISWQMLVMWVVCALLFYLAIAKQFEPMLLIPISFGALLANLPTLGIYQDGSEHMGLYDYLYKGIEYEIYPPLIFLGVGALTDFGP